MAVVSHVGGLSVIAARPLTIPSSGTISLGAGHADPRLARRASRAARASRASGAAVALFTALVLLTVTCGWFFHDRIPLTPKSGPGYALGVSGGVTMILLGFYPVRKRVRFMRSWGPLSRWFRVHMILGVLGPVLILFHCNFRLGAPNSNVALGSMLIVAASGVVGRYIYTRISHGLYGARATLQDLQAQLDFSAHTLGDRLPLESRALQRLAAFAASARAPRRKRGGRFLRLAALPILAAWVRRGVLRDLRADLAREATRVGWDARTRRASEAAARRVIRAYIAALVKEVQFGAYERLFSLWHALHVPLFFMLVLTGIMHVVAVHMY